MSAFFGALATALWLGVLTSISPCPLASNIAAVSFVGRNVASPRRAVFAGLAYAVGRAVAYVVVGALAVSALLSISGISFFLQNQMSRLLGPALIVIGAGILWRSKLLLATWSWGEGMTQRAARSGTLGACALGMMFALAFCPVSAGLFFGGLVPLAIGARSPVVLPALFGIGTALPVVLFAVLLAFGVHRVGRAFAILAKVERVAGPATGVVFILAGAYLAARSLGASLTF